MLLKKIFYKIAYGGSTQLSYLEIKIFNSVMTLLNEEKKNVVEDQIRNIFFIQREHHNRMTRYTINKQNCEPLRLDVVDCVIAEIVCMIGDKKYSFKLTSYEGYIYGLESNKEISRGEFRLKPEKIFINVVWTEYDGLSTQLDTEEH